METENQADLDFKSAGKIIKKYKLSKLWEKAKRSENDKVVAVEVPLNSIDKFGFLTAETEELMRNTGIFDYALSETSLLIQKNKATGLITAHFMTIVGDPEYLDKTDFKVNTNNFLKKDKDFSGMVLFHELNGLFNIGWKYSDGTITHRISSTSQGIIHDLNFYKEAIKYDFSNVIENIETYGSGEDEYSILFYSTKDCN